MALQPVSFRWPPDLVARIDGARGDVARSVWVRRALEAALDHRAIVESTTPPIAHGIVGERQLSRSEMFKRATQR